MTNVYLINALTPFSTKPGIELIFVRCFILQVFRYTRLLGNFATSILVHYLFMRGFNKSAGSGSWAGNFGLLPGEANKISVERQGDGLEGVGFL